jgi:conjugal transfer mating pair stabilization protein TraG
MTWEIVTYGNADLLTIVFNGIAMIFGGTEIWKLMQIIALVSVGIWMFQAAFSAGDFTPKTLIIIVFVLMALIMPKADVYLNDKIFPENNTVISNVPLSLAASVSTFNLIGHWLARVMETVFSLPNGQNYTDGGMLWGNKLMQASLEHNISDPRTSANISRFSQSCIVMDLALERYGVQDILASKDISTFLDSSSSTLYVDYEDDAGVTSLVTCEEAWTNIDKTVTASVDLELGVVGRLVTTGKAANASILDRVKSSLPVGLQYISGSAQTESEIIKQTMLMNAIDGGFSGNYANVSQDYVLAVAERERSISQSVLAKIGRDRLPQMRNIYEALIIALFPIVAMMMMLPTAAKVGLGYIKVVVWINLWIPLYALIHFVANFYSAQAVQGLPDMGSGISLLNRDSLASEMQDAADMVGYMSLSIPMFAWMFLQQGGSLAAGMANRMVQGFESSVGGAAGNAALGNYNLGNTSADNTNNNKTNLAIEDTDAFLKNTSASGTSITDNSGGTESVNVNQDNIGTGIKISDQVSERAEANYSQAVSNSNQTGMDLASSNGATLSEAQTYGNQLSTADSTRDVTTDSGSTSFDKSVQEVNSLDSQAAKELGVTDTAMDRMMASAKAGVQFNSGDQVLGMLGEAASGLSIVGAAGVEGSTSSEDRAMEAYKSVQSYAASDKYTEAVKDVAQVTEQLSADKTDSASRAFNESIGSQVTEQESFSEKNSVAQANTAQAQEALSRSESITASTDKDLQDEFLTSSVQDGVWSSKADAMSDLRDYNNSPDSEGGQRVQDALDTFTDETVMPRFNALADNNVSDLKNSGDMSNDFESKTGSDLKAEYSESSPDFKEAGNQEVTNAGIQDFGQVEQGMDADGSLNSAGGIVANNNQIRETAGELRDQGKAGIESGEAKISNSGDHIQGTVKDNLIEGDLGGMTDTDYAIDVNETYEGSGSAIDNSFHNKNVMDQAELFDAGNDFNTYGNSGKDLDPIYDDSGKIDHGAMVEELRELNNPNTVPELNRNQEDDMPSYDEFSKNMQAKGN